jgi:opacity protein-like surface antigen
MHAKFSKSGILAVGFLTACLLAGAAPVAAAAAGGEGDRTVPPNHGFLFDKDAYAITRSQVETGGAQTVSKLSLRLYGGYNHMLAGDVNEGSDYYFELVEAYLAEGYGTATGGYKPLHGGYAFGADLVYQLTPSFGIGIGAGFVRSSAKSLGAFTDEETVDLLAETNLSAVPIRLGLFLDFPLGGKFALTANAGAAYYLGLKFTGMQGVELSASEWMRMSLEASERSGADIGFHGGLGLEYKLSPKLGLFVEGVGRYAKLKNFESVTGTQEYDDGSSDTTTGKLYLLIGNTKGFEISMFEISETEPTPDPGSTVREPKFDLGGFSLQAGIRIRL